MKKKVPKFLIGRNTAAKPESTYVVHTQDPPFVGEIITFESLIDREAFVADNSEKEIIQVTPTTLLIIEKYLNTTESIVDKPYLENKLTHWIIANYLNSNAFEG